MSLPSQQASTDSRVEAMNEEEKYTFDLQGYLRIEGAIDCEALARMNAWVDDQALGDPRWLGQPGIAHLNDVLTWGPDFRALLDNPVVLPHLKELLGEGVRLDHDYAIFLQPGGEGLPLHGGATPHDPAQHYYCAGGRMYNGLMVAAYALTDVPEGVGGFACIPGSHKSHYPCPEDIHRLRRSSPLVRQVPVRAGACILFTEALLHGTLPWKGPHVRRTVFFKFSPGYMSWSDSAYLPMLANEKANEVLAELNPMQRALLRAPGVYRRGPVP